MAYKASRTPTSRTTRLFLSRPAFLKQSGRAVKPIVLLVFALMIGCASSERFFSGLGGGPTPERILKKYGNDYSYATISGSRIYYCKPIVENATIVVNDKRNFFDKTRTETEESKDIAKTFFQYFNSEIRVKNLPWRVLNDTAMQSFTLLNENDSVSAIAATPESYASLADRGVDYLIVIYKVNYLHEQSAVMTHNKYTMEKNMTDIDLDFNYRCAVFDVKNKKAIMHVAMRETSSDPINFYDTICKNLFSVILYGK